MGNRDSDALPEAQREAFDGLPVDFQRAMRAFADRGGVCAVSRVAQDMHGEVRHVEWGVTSPWRDDWVAGPCVADADDVVQAIAAGEEVWTLFATATGFARGPALVIGPTGRLALAPGGPDEWTLGMLARLTVRPPGQ